MNKPLSSAVLLSSILGMLFTQGAFADTVVFASLWDNGPVMGLTLDKETAPAGNVIFHVVNNSKIVEHEMLIVKVKEFSDSMPLDRAANRLTEDSLEAIGETHGLQPGQYKKVEFNLKPGKYLLICNKAGHFEDGMFTKFIVSN
jgi:uncharacterized cupredoxin-like copper-binding protein